MRARIWTNFYPDCGPTDASSPNGNPAVVAGMTSTVKVHAGECAAVPVPYPSASATTSTSTTSSSSSSSSSSTTVAGATVPPHLEPNLVSALSVDAQLLNLQPFQKCNITVHEVPECGDDPLL